MPVSKTRTDHSGFTLIELMIVVAIVALLAAIAFPSYARYVEQARRADAKSALMDAAQRLERCYTQNNSYDGCTVAAASPDGYYTIEATIPDPFQSFTLSAAPTGVQTDSPCGTYTLDSDGTRGSGGDNDRCW